MTSEEFEQWYEFVNDGSLRDAAYTGLVTGPEEIERSLAKAEKDKNTLLVALEAATKEIERMKHQYEWLGVENTKLKSFVSELEKWIYNHHYAGDSQAEALMERARKDRR